MRLLSCVGRLDLCSRAVSSGRKHVTPEERERWVFNRMAHAYEHRPPYPEDLIDLVLAASPCRQPVLVDVGAGTGHLAIPLARKGASVHAVEPAEDMLASLVRRAEGLLASSGTERGRVTAHHAAAEWLPLPDSSVDVGLVSDALHFLDRARTVAELRRVLRPGGALVLVICEFEDTPFMAALSELMREAAPRRPRNVDDAAEQLMAGCKVRVPRRQVIGDHTELTAMQLEGILDTISFIGPAMSPERRQRFRRHVEAIAYPRIWSRRMTVWSGRSSVAP